jgi:BirA family transcriptional regulator, biotin operon repressor / biotin---[acetyl-CoA-carboxylase] ligase
MEYPLSAQIAAGFEYLEQTGSSNQDLLEKANTLPEFYVLATDFQTAGRGRMQRSWEAAAGSSIMASILLRPRFSNPSGIGWLSLMAALAIGRSLESTGVDCSIKWPNDVLISDKKVSGILAEASSNLDEVVIGFGINVFQAKNELPFDQATSLAIETNVAVSRDQLLASVIQNIKDLYQQLSAFDGDAEGSGLRTQLIKASATIGNQVSVQLPGEKKIIGFAKDIDSAGRLVLVSNDQTLTVSAGDVIHLRSI